MNWRLAFLRSPFSAEIIPAYEFVKPRLNLFPAVSLNEGYLGFGSDSTDSINQVDKEMCQRRQNSAMLCEK